MGLATLDADLITDTQVAALAAKVGERYPVYELPVLFMAHTGLRAAEVQGLEVRDVTLTARTATHAAQFAWLAPRHAAVANG